jgi:hypothetical protein
VVKKVLLKYSIQGRGNLNHQAAAPDITEIKSPQYFKTSVRVQFPEILRGNERAGMNIGQVDDVHPAGPSGRKQ